LSRGMVEGQVQLAMSSIKCPLRDTAGYAVGKAPADKSKMSVAKGMHMATKRLIYIQLFEDRTIYHDFYAECRSTRVFAQPRPDGYGLYCHPRLIKICEIIGIKDIYVKVEGSTNNYIALAHAFITGLLHQESHQQLAERKGLHVVEMSPERSFLPRIIASPIHTPLRVEDQLTPEERLSLEDFYGEGRQPLYKPRPAPFYKNSPGHLYAEWKRFPFRNRDKSIVRMLSDGIVNRWTRDERHAWAEKKDEAIASGIDAMPIGLGLSKIHAQKEK